MESLDDRPVAMQVTMQVAMQVRALEPGFLERPLPYKPNSWTQKVNPSRTRQTRHGQLGKNISYGPSHP